MLRIKQLLIGASAISMAAGVTSISSTVAEAAFYGQAYRQPRHDPAAPPPDSNKANDARAAAISEAACRLLPISVDSALSRPVNP